jgi:hypothetical protein
MISSPWTHSSGQTAVPQRGRAIQQPAQVELRTHADQVCVADPLRRTIQRESEETARLRVREAEVFAVNYPLAEAKAEEQSPSAGRGDVRHLHDHERHVVYLPGVAAETREPVADRLRDVRR